MTQTDTAIRLMIAGVGGAGLNALNAMLAAGLEGVETVAISCSVPRLRKSMARRTLQIGDDQRGFGTGGDPVVARAAAEQSRVELQRLVAGVDLLVLVAGLGGGTGSGAAPVVARLAQETGALVVAVVIRPFGREGRRRALLAEQALQELGLCTDSLIVLANDRLISQAARGQSLLDAFKPCDDLLRQAVTGMIEVIATPGHINVDFSDLRTVLTCRGMSLVGVGTAAGEHRAMAAATAAIQNPLLEGYSLHEAHGLLLNISGSSSMTMDEYDQVCSLITEQLPEDATIIVGMVIDEALADLIRVTVIATGIRAGDEPAGVRPLRKVQKGGQ